MLVGIVLCSSVREDFFICPLLCHLLTHVNQLMDTTEACAFFDLGQGLKKITVMAGEKIILDIN